jgi:hypothetical protein
VTADSDTQADDHHGHAYVPDFRSLLVGFAWKFDVNPSTDAVVRFIFPDSPLNAWFLTAEERIIAVSRLRVNQTGIENKHFKRDQFLEALRDPKTWLFAAFAGFS